MFYFDATCAWLMREFKSIEIDRYQQCNNTDDEPRNEAISCILSYSGQISSKTSRTFSLRGAQVLDHPAKWQNHAKISRKFLIAKKVDAKTFAFYEATFPRDATSWRKRWFTRIINTWGVRLYVFVIMFFTSHLRVCATDGSQGWIPEICTVIASCVAVRSISTCWSEGIRKVLLQIKSGQKFLLSWWDPTWHAFVALERCKRWPSTQQRWT